MLNTNDIIKVLPHKHPYLLVDRIIEMQPGERAVGLKAISYAESVFAGHFPEEPIFPGALIVEASSQVAGFITYEKNNLIGYVVEIKSFKFNKPVKPGCMLQIEAKKINARGPFLEAGIEVTTNDELVANGTLQLFIRKEKPQTKNFKQKAGGNVC